jgi:Zn-dependent metalloprotease
MFNFLSDIFQRNSIDDAGMNLMGSVHYGQKYNNAFWNGHQMVFGDGDGVYFNRFTVSLDIIGHELAHGITARTANLAYSGQSGALNESVSDVFGSMLKQYNLNQEAADADWLIGEGLYTSNVRGDALRSMKAPGTAYNDPVLGKDPQPATFDDFVATISDAGGVHINSGIPNHAFYLVAVAFGGYSWEKAGQIWYATLKDSRLQPNADFKAFANLTADNALKAFGDSAKDIVTQAWTDVGVF